MASIWALLLLALPLCLAIKASEPEVPCTVYFGADFNQPTTPWNHYWSECVGSGHATLALRQDWRAQLTQSQKELGFRFVRFHGLLDDDMSTYLGNGTSPDYSFFNVDSIFDFLLSINMKPLVELSFMPEMLASGTSTIFHYQGNTTPPKSLAVWSQLISALAQHLESRYGATEVRSWRFEVWNEPNLAFWNGTQAQYFQFYNATAWALKTVDSQLRVGGPVTAQSQWIPAFRQYTSANNVPVDFITTHEYPTDISPLQRGILKRVFTQAQQEAAPLPLIYSEYNCGLGINCDDTSYAAAFVMFNVWDIMPLGLDIMSYWTFTDIFEEGGFESQPFHQGFGMLNINGVPKPVYRAFELLHRTGDQQVFVNTTGNNLTAGAFVVKHSDEKVREFMIVIYNHNIPGGAIRTEYACVTLAGLTPNIVNGIHNVTLEQIDSTHANAPQAWVNMGSPAYLTPDQITQLVKASQVIPSSLSYTKVSSSYVTLGTIGVPPEGVAVITVYY